jgi:hypothetical protein
MHPQMHNGEGPKCRQASCTAFPAHHEAAIRRLEPGKGPLRLEPWPRDGDRAAPRFRGLPDVLRDLRSDPALTELLAQGLRLLALIRREPRGAFPRASGMACAPMDGVPERPDWRAFSSMGWREALGQGPASTRRQPMEQEALAWPTPGPPLTPALPRGTQRPPRRPTPRASSRAPGPPPTPGPASPPGCHPPANAVTSDRRHAWKPRAVPAGYHPSDSRCSRGPTRC